MSESRAQQWVRWLEDRALERRARLGEVYEGLGRLQCLAGPLEHARPFLGPVYAWASRAPRYARPTLPVVMLP